MSVTRINEFHAADGKEAALHAFLTNVIAQVRGAPGCESVALYTDPTDAARFLILETWDSIEAHKAAASRIPPEQMAAFMPLIAEPPRGRYYSR
jgi:quinol monooxygenase YgiN